MDGQPAGSRCRAAVLRHRERARNARADAAPCGRDMRDSGLDRLEPDNARVGQLPAWRRARQRPMAGAGGCGEEVLRPQAPRQQHHPHPPRRARCRPIVLETRLPQGEEHPRRGRDGKREDPYVRHAERAPGEPGLLLHRHQGDPVEEPGADVRRPRLRRGGLLDQGPRGIRPLQHPRLPRKPHRHHRMGEGVYIHHQRRGGEIGGGVLDEHDGASAPHPGELPRILLPGRGPQPQRAHHAAEPRAGERGGRVVRQPLRAAHARDRGRHHARREALRTGRAAEGPPRFQAGVLELVRMAAGGGPEGPGGGLHTAVLDAPEGRRGQDPEIGDHLHQLPPAVDDGAGDARAHDVRRDGPRPLRRGGPQARRLRGDERHHRRLQLPDGDDGLADDPRLHRKGGQGPRRGAAPPPAPDVRRVLQPGAPQPDGPRHHHRPLAQHIHVDHAPVRRPARGPLRGARGADHHRQLRRAPVPRRQVDEDQQDAERDGRQGDGRLRDLERHPRYHRVDHQEPQQAGEGPHPGERSREAAPRQGHRHLQRFGSGHRRQVPRRRPSPMEGGRRP